MNEYKLRNSNHKIRYFDFKGNKTPILFIHGLGCAGSFDYVEVVTQEVLSEHRRIVVDLLGAGYSDKPKDFTYNAKSHAKYLSEFLEDIGLQKVIIYGHSLGGAVSIELCQLCGDKVEKLILNEPNLEPSQKGAGSWEIAQLDGENIDLEMSRKIEEYEKKGYSMWVSTLRNWLPKAVYDLSENAVKGGEPSWKMAYLGFMFPKCVIFGGKTLPDKDYDDLKRNNEELLVVENAGHSMAWENPVELAVAIKKCL